MDITAAAPLNSCPDETHHLVSLRLSGFYVGKCGTERWKSAWSSCERWTWLPMSSSLSGTLSSGNMEVESAWECSLKSRRKLPFMDLSSAFHGRDSVGLIELLQIPTPILTNFFFTSEIILQVNLGIQTSLWACPLKTMMMFLHVCQLCSYFSQSSKWLLFIIKALR